MTIHILYETYSSSTTAVVEIVEQELKAKGHDVKISLMGECMNFMDDLADLVIFATPSWFDRGIEGQPHMAFLAYMDDHTDADFSALNCAFIGLGDSSYAHFCLAIDTLEDFFTKRGARSVGAALKLDSFQLNPVPETEKLHAWISLL